MKKLALLPFLLFLATASWCQDCSHYLLLQNNKTVETTIYNKKNEPIGKRVSTVSNVTNNGGVTSATINTQMFDKKGNSTGTSTSTLKCTGGAFQLDMKMMLPEGQAEKMSSAKVTGGEGIVEYPAGMKAGDTLKSANLVLSNSNLPPPPAGGAPGPPPPPIFGGSNLSMVIWDRKVEGQESVTTPAGTWNCFKISFKSRVSYRSGPLPVNHTADLTEWYAPGVGVIKTESKDGSTAVTSIK
ncbi:MAG TPA: hypothetical protein VGR89_01500 [Puia sp.]|nr:hypothetical protein [Puia sp.]